MKFFENYFSDVDFYKEGAEEVKVLCPFHNDTNPSASINIEKEVFHCWVCKVGYNEQQFISKVNDISVVDASKVLSNLEGTKTNEWSVVSKANLWVDNDMLNALRGLRLSDELIEDLELGQVEDKLRHKRLGIPVFYNKVLMDVRSYDIMKTSSIKMLNELDADNGYVIPYDKWVSTPKEDITYVFEGEKDMLVARGMGLNAICLTGGAGAVPNDMVINQFRDRNIVLCYDNDEAGVEGIKNVYFAIKHLVNSIKFIDISDVVENNKEDFTDAVFKYNMDLFQFLSLDLHEFNNVQKDLTTIKYALDNHIIKQRITSKVAVSGEFEDTYAVPTMVTITKTSENAQNDTMVEGETRTWYLEKRNIHHLLNLIETDAKKAQVLSKIKGFLDIPSKEQALDIKISDYVTIFKSRVSDLEADGGKLDIYSFEKLKVGQNYEVTYKIHPHPTKNQKLVVLASSITNADEIQEFTPNPDYLRYFQKGKTIQDRLDYQYESAKFYVAPHLNYHLWLTTDLVLNSIYEFEYGDTIRGMLDVFILGDTQVGKSETTSKLASLYSFGHFLSLKTSTVIGLIGGSSKVDGSWLNTIGAIPRQHGKAVIMEEFSGAPPMFIKTMTDVRSSGEIRITRAAGELHAPCKLRMLTLSNAINDDQGNPRNLTSFPNGVIPLMELIKSAEDVARYDGFTLVAKPEKRFNPFGVSVIDNPIPEIMYKHKINWVYSRKKEHVVFADNVKSYIWDKAEEINKLYECNFPVFGTTTALKLARYSVAMASLIVSTDETYENVIVTKEIVDKVFDYLVSNYSNDIFKLREYKIEYDSYSVITDEQLKEMQELYSRHSTLFEWINSTTKGSRNDLQSISGLKSDHFSPLFNRLVAMKLVRISGMSVYPTPKFRKGMKKIDKTIVQDTGQSMVDLSTKVRATE